MDTLIAVVFFGIVFVVGAGLLGGLIARGLFDFVTAPLRNDEND